MGGDPPGQQSAYTGFLKTAGSDPFASISSPVLHLAARSVAAEHLHEEGSEPGIRELDALLSLARELDGSTPLHPPSYTELEPALLRRMLERLRGEVLREWSRWDVPPTAEEMLELLNAFEHTRQALESSAELTSPAAEPKALELVVDFAHDLRSPLTSVLFLAETIRAGHSGDLGDLQRKQLGIIYSAALGLVHMASDVIDLARGNEGEQHTQGSRSPFSIREMLASIRDVLAPMAEVRNLELRVQAPEEDQRVGNPVALSRILLNLATNALKFTESGFVEISARSGGGHRVEFSVRDTGPGLDPAAHSELYQPFRRSPAQDTYRFSGTGLGLAICRKLVTALGSEIHYETAPDWGTRFFFELELPPNAPA